MALACPALRAETRELPGIIVVAPFLGTDARDLTQDVYVVPGDEIDARSEFRLTDALSGIPGLDLQNTGTLRQNSTLHLRGADPEHTLVLFDGMEASDPLAPSGTLPLELFPPEDIERIEVIKGPQGTLYGSKAIGGVVNVVTRKGEGPARVSLGGGGGNLGTIRTRQGVSGSAGPIHYRVSALQSRTDGWSNARESGEDAAGRYENPERDGRETTSYSGRAGASLTRFWDVEVSGRRLDADLEADNAPGRGGDDVNREETYRAGVAQGRIDGRFFGGRLRQRLAASHGRYAQNVHNPVDADHPAEFLFSDFDAVANRFDWRWEWAGRVERVIAGYEKSLEKADSREVGTGAVGFTTVSGARAEDIGRYAQANLVWDSDRFKSSIGGGGRHESHSRGRSATTYSAGGAFSWHPSHTTARFNYGTGYRVPGLAALFSAVGNPDLRPEEATGREFSVEQALARTDDFSLDAGWTWFRTDVTNLITFNFLTFRLENVARARMQGHEYELAARWRRRWRFTAGYTAQKAVERISGEDGPPLKNRADRKASVSAGYDAGVWDARVDYRYVGKRPDENAASQRVVLGSYGLVDLSARVRVTHWVSLKGSVKNIFDEEYEELLGFGTPPRSYFAEAEVRFGPDMR